MIDELIFRFTHDLEMDWMLPGVAPTGRRVEVPLVVVVQTERGEVVFERIYWDQALRPRADRTARRIRAADRRHRDRTQGARPVAAVERS